MRTQIEYPNDNVRARWRYDVNVAHEAVEEWVRHLESGDVKMRHIPLTFRTRELPSGRIVAMPCMAPYNRPEWKLFLSKSAFGRVRKWTGLEWSFVSNLLNGGHTGLQMLAATVNGRLKTERLRKTALLFRPDAAHPVYVVRDFRRDKDTRLDVAAFAAHLETMKLPKEWTLVAYRLSDYAHQFRYQTGPNAVLDLCFSVVRQLTYAQASYVTGPCVARVDNHDFPACKLVVPTEQLLQAALKVEGDFRGSAGPMVHQSAQAAILEVTEPLRLASRFRGVMVARRVPAQFRDALLSRIAYLGWAGEPTPIGPVLEEISDAVGQCDDPWVANRMERCTYDLLTMKDVSATERADRKAVAALWKVGDADPTRRRQVSFVPAPPAAG